MTECQLTKRAETMIDTRVLREFLDLLGPEGPSLLRGIVEAYLKESPPVVEDLGEALFSSDHSKAAWLAHRLKGSCLSIGARHLAHHCAELEATCLARMHPPAASYAALVADFTATRRTLKVFLKDLS
jgi:HPt (histidine-containing phosphotransfer) domain-containing protein